MSTLVVTALRVVCLAYLTAMPPQGGQIREAGQAESDIIQIGDAEVAEKETAFIGEVGNSKPEIIEAAQPQTAPKWDKVQTQAEKDREKQQQLKVPEAARKATEDKVSRGNVENKPSGFPTQVSRGNVENKPSGFPTQDPATVKQREWDALDATKDSVEQITEAQRAAREAQKARCTEEKQKTCNQASRDCFAGECKAFEKDARVECRDTSYSLPTWQIGSVTTAEEGNNKPEVRVDFWDKSYEWDEIRQPWQAGYPCDGILTSDAGTQYHTIGPFKIGDVWVFGAPKGNLFEMVSVDVWGTFMEAKYKKIEDLTSAMQKGIVNKQLFDDCTIDEYAWRYGRTQSNGPCIPKVTRFCEGGYTQRKNPDKRKDCFKKCDWDAPGQPSDGDYQKPCTELCESEYECRKRCIAKSDKASNMGERSSWNYVDPCVPDCGYNLEPKGPGQSQVSDRQGDNGVNAVPKSEAADAKDEEIRRWWDKPPSKNTSMKVTPEEHLRRAIERKDVPFLRKTLQEVEGVEVDDDLKQQAFFTLEDAIWEDTREILQKKIDDLDKLSGERVTEYAKELRDVISSAKKTGAEDSLLEKAEAAYKKAVLMIPLIEAKKRVYRDYHNHTLNQQLEDAIATYASLYPGDKESIIMVDATQILARAHLKVAIDKAPPQGGEVTPEYKTELVAAMEAAAKASTGTEETLRAKDILRTPEQREAKALADNELARQRALGERSWGASMKY